jgi:hypothetical protein
MNRPALTFWDAKSCGTRIGRLYLHLKFPAYEMLYSERSGRVKPLIRWRGYRLFAIWKRN